MTRKNTLTSRRSFIKKGAASVAFVAAAPQFITRSKAADNYVVVNTWGGSWGKAEAKAYYLPFQKASGIEVKPVTPFSFAKLKAQVRARCFWLKSQWQQRLVPVFRCMRRVVQWYWMSVAAHRKWR